MEYESEIRRIVSETIKFTTSIDNLDTNADLREVGLNSITFVGIIVAIEDQYCIEIPDDYLIIDFGNTISKLCEIIMKVVAGNNEDDLMI